MIERVLIANRGEIAVRIVRACHRLGRAAVVAYSDADADSLALSLADDGIALGGVAPAESYLAVDKIVSAAHRAGCDAVHPGYGFLAERADFAREVTAAGLVFVGPSAEVIEMMGDKLAARRAAIAAGVPVVPGTTVELEDAETLIRRGGELGWPIAVKAAYGGGGRGMRVVRSPEHAAEAVAAAQREAASAFGRSEVYLERFLSEARHVEVQVVADHHGQVVSVGERDCSVQRRYQKLIEEAPAPNLSDHLRQSLAASAVALARSVGYTSVGTVEYLVEGAEFFFLEMNTRIQVEHPVTELVTGLDLVAEQLLIADGHPLSFDPDTVTPRGAAIEIRVNAENSAGGRFVPTPGVLSRWSPPTGPDVRVDTGYRAGDPVSPHYDNLIAKISIWGRDREDARRRAIAALGEMEITGVPTTASAACTILEHGDFIGVRHSTRWLEHHAAELFPEAESSADAPVVADPSSDPGSEPAGPPSVVEVAGRWYRIPRFADRSGDSGPAGPGLVPSEGPAQRGLAARTATRRTGSGRLTAPMQGTIIKVAAMVGDAVEIGDPLLVLEAMKMENTLTSDVRGTVAEVLVEAGSSVAPGQLLAVVTADPAP